MKKLAILFFILLFFTKAQAQEKKKIEADKKTSSMVYAMKHPMHEWDATSKEAKCVIVLNTTTQKIEAVAVIVPVKSFDSGNSNRDSHTIEVLEALKYPNISFSASNVQDTGNQILVIGNLTFHGVTKSIEINANKTLSKTLLKVEGHFLINMKDYGIDPPGLMGIRADEKIALNFIMSFNL